MSRLTLLVGALCIFATPTIAQQRMHIDGGAAGKSDQTAITEPTQLHITDVLLASPAGQEAASEYRQAKADGLLPKAGAAKTQLTLSAQQIFKVRNPVTLASENIDFTLRASSERFDIWVETAETVPDEVVTSLKAALADETPSGSYDSGAGIIVNDEIVFGDPPDRDGDSKTDVLLLDVRDEYDPANGKNLYIGGFFDPVDQGSSGNQKDILYLDLRPSVFDAEGGIKPLDALLATAAHEYQHLIHWRYDTGESTFVNEAQSEWAELMNGYDGRSMAFLTSTGEHGTSFFNYRDNVLTDRERGQLFTLYVAEQEGVLVAGNITRQNTRDEVGYAAAIGTLDDVYRLVFDFFTANLINDISVDPRFGYSNAFNNDRRTIVDENLDARGSTDLPARTLSMKSGAVRYVKVRNPENLVINVDANSSAGQTAARGRIGVRVLKKQGGGSYTFEDHVASEDPININGVYDEVVLLIVNKQVTSSAITAATVDVTYAIDWVDPATNQFVEGVSYDDGSPTDNFFTDNARGFTVQATRFERPNYNGTVVLDEVQVAPYFLSQFSGGGQATSAARDFKLMVLGDNNGLPDLQQKIFEMNLTDTRSYAPATLSPFTFMNVSLTENANELNNLPDVFYVALAEAGTDQNYFVLAPSTYATSNVSFLGDERNNSWGQLWSVELSDGTVLTEHVFPIRVNFLVNEIVGVEDQVLSEPDFVLSQNYPNPFQAETQIQFTLPKSADVHLEVFDLLGRKIATLVNGTYPSGTHSVRVDASDWAGGLYVYRLRSGDTSLTRTMAKAE